MSSSSAGSGSSSTTIAMLLIASRNRRGIEASASATSFSNFSRCTTGRWAGRATSRHVDDRAEVVALALNRAGVTEGLRATDTAAVKDERIRRPRPACLWHRRTELLLDNSGVVALRDSDTVRN